MKQQKPKNSHSPHAKKRYGHHQKRNKMFHNTYLPYLPMTLILFISVFVSGYNPRQATLAYATEMSRQTLLTSTNIERAQNGRSALTLNDKLNIAAQAKANDMITRNYWSHNTPDGNEPWVFINDAGYSYLKAGENLAYGFATSAATVDGWMNSPSHKDNLLDGDFREVGFGYANGNDYNNAGEETVVVAMYGNPYVLASTTQSPAPTQPEAVPTPAATAATPTPSATPTNTPTPVKVEATPKEDKKPVTAKAPASNSATQPQYVVASAQPVSRIESLLNKTSPWLVSGITFVTGFLIALLLLRHGIRLRKLLRDSQNFITHHPLIDSTVLALIVLGVTLTRTVGYLL